MEFKFDGVECCAIIKVVGVGGGGIRAVDNMIESGLEGVEFLVTDIDTQALGASQAKKKIQLSEQLFLSYLRLRADQNPTNPKNAMPNYSASTLSDEQALNIYAYIKSLKDDSQSVEDNPVMQEMLDAAKARNPGNEN